MVLLFVINLYASVFNQIITNKPKIDRTFAKDLTIYIHKYAKKYEIPVDIFTAMLMQESSYNLSAVRKTCENKENGINCIYTDFGISQINIGTVKRYGFDIKKLTTNLEYSIEAGAIVLSDLRKKYEKEDILWFSRYNCGTRGAVSRRKPCLIYANLVNRYMNNKTIDERLASDDVIKY